jgi:hypothetical protein
MRLFPTKITAGLSFALTLNLPDFPAGVWTLHAYLRGPKSITLAATPTGVVHVFSVAPADTGHWIPGDYWLSLRATDGTNVSEIATEQVKIAADLAQAPDGYDGRTENEIALDSINAVLGRRATRDQQRYSINNRELWRTPIHELLKLQSFYQARVNQERRRANGCGKFGRPITVKFTT